MCGLDYCADIAIELCFPLWFEMLIGTFVMFSLLLYLHWFRLLFCKHDWIKTICKIKHYFIILSNGIVICEYSIWIHRYYTILEERISDIGFNIPILYLYRYVPIYISNIPYMVVVMKMLTGKCKSKHDNNQIIRRT